MNPALIPILLQSVMTLVNDAPLLMQHWSGKGSTAKALAIVQDAAGVASDVAQHVTPAMLGAKMDNPNAPTAHEAACAVAGVDPVTLQPLPASAVAAAVAASSGPAIDYDKLAAAMVRAQKAQ